MSSGAGTEIAEIMAGVLVAIVLLALPIAVWRKAVLAPYRAARQLLERLSAEAGGLQVVNANTSSLEEPGLLTFTAPWPIARGRRGALVVELATQQGYKYDRPYTMVNVTERGRTGPELGAAHAFTFRYLHALALNPLLLSARRAIEPAGRRTVQTAWMGEAVAWGPPEAFDRFFDERGRELLRGFPRELSYVSFDGRGTVSILWYGIEGDLAVVERAFRLGAELLEHATQTRVLR
jgi:hypothetical protein